jgi:co-chaperonin GroES (HSP10)
MLVEVIKDEEFEKKVTTDSGKVVGIIMNADLSAKSQKGGLGADKPTFARVLMVGEGYDNEDGKEKLPLDSKPGDIILIPEASIKKVSVFGKLVSYGETTLGLVRDSEVQMRFSGSEAFDKFFELLNEKVTNGKR